MASPGENCQCVYQCLKDMFEYMGCVPVRIVFDNATGIGKRIQGRNMRLSPGSDCITDLNRRSQTLTQDKRKGLWRTQWVLSVVTVSYLF